MEGRVDGQTGGWVDGWVGSGQLYLACSSVAESLRLYCESGVLACES